MDMLSLQIQNDFIGYVLKSSIWSLFSIGLSLVLFSMYLIRPIIQSFTVYNDGSESAPALPLIVRLSTYFFMYFVILPELRAVGAFWQVILIAMVMLLICDLMLLYNLFVMNIIKSNFRFRWF